MPARPQVTNEIIPVLPYSHLAMLVPIFLLTDYLRYKPVLVLQCLSFVCVWLLLLLGDSVIHMQLMEVFYSITMAARIAYSSYIFSLVHPSRYQRMASYSRASVLLGVFISSVLGQLLVTVQQITFHTLNCISLGFIVFSLGLSLFLKRPKRSLFFNRSALVREALPCELDQMHPGPGQPKPRKLERVLGTCRDSFLVRMLSDLVENLRQPQLRLWCLWWVFNSAGYYLITYYVHVLWRKIDPKVNYNGAVDAASTLLSMEALCPSQLDPSRPVVQPYPLPLARPPTKAALSLTLPRPRSRATLTQPESRPISPKVSLAPAQP